MTVLDDLQRGLTLLAAKQPGYLELRNYEAGRQPIMFSSKKFQEFYEQVMRRYRLNICRPVVRQTARRLDIETWEGDQAAAAWWEETGLLLQNRAHREAVRQGDGYLLTWPRQTMSGPLKTNRLRADEAIVVYSEEDPDQAAYGVKIWTVIEGPVKDERRRLRANVYYPDRVVRWLSVSWGGKQVTVENLTWDPYEGDGNGDTAGSEIFYEGTLKQAGADGVLPLQHLAVQPDDTPYGTSVLSDVLPVQDSINKHSIDILVTSEQFGLPLRAMLGLEEVTETTVDADGTVHTSSNLDSIEYDPRVDYLLTLPGEHSKLIQLPAADLTRLLEVKRAAIQDATLVSNVPLMLLAEDSGNIPTGVALREVKAPLTELVVDISQDLTVPWRNVARLYGWEAAPQWAAPFEMDELERWEIAQAKIDAGWPVRQAIIETGLDPEMVDRVFEEAAEVDSSVGSALMRAFRDGRDPADLVRG